LQIPNSKGIAQWHAPLAARIWEKEEARTWGGILICPDKEPKLTDSEFYQRYSFGTNFELLKFPSWEGIKGWVICFNPPGIKLPSGFRHF